MHRGHQVVALSPPPGVLRQGDAGPLDLALAGAPADCTAAGKVLLAELDDDALAALLPEQRLVGLMSLSITRRRELLRQLAEIRQRGYAINVGESEEGLTAVAVAVWDARGLVPGAITVAGPSSRLEAETLPAIAAAIARRVQTITFSTGSPDRAAHDLLTATAVSSRGPAPPAPAPSTPRPPAGSPGRWPRNRMARAVYLDWEIAPWRAGQWTIRNW